MPAWICRTCANQHSDSASPPDGCAICLDERQYVPPGGQRWTTLEELAAEGHRARVEEAEPNLHRITVTPEVGIGQGSLLLQTPGGNLLWEPTGYLDDATIADVRALGGVAAIAASHPHMYGLLVEWSRAFDDAPIHLTQADAEWVMRPDDAIAFWSGELEVLPGVRLVQLGGHFAGSCVAHWPAGADGRGVLLTGDTIAVIPDRGWVSFMRSYPNYIPLSAAVVRRIADTTAPYAFDRLYGSFGAVMDRDAKAAVARSADRYIDWISGRYDADT